MFFGNIYGIRIFERNCIFYISRICIQCPVPIKIFCIKTVIVLCSIEFTIIGFGNGMLRIIVVTIVTWNIVAIFPLYTIETCIFVFIEQTILVFILRINCTVVANNSSFLCPSRYIFRDTSTNVKMECSACSLYPEFKKPQL